MKHYIYELFVFSRNQGAVIWKKSYLEIHSPLLVLCFLMEFVDNKKHNDRCQMIVVKHHDITEQFKFSLAVEQFTKITVWFIWRFSGHGFQFGKFLVKRGEVIAKFSILFIYMSWIQSFLNKKNW